MARLYRPTCALWDGATVWVLLEGDRRDVADQVAGLPLEAVERSAGAADGRAVVDRAPAAHRGLSGRFVVELGVGIVHHEEPAPARVVDPVVRDLHRRIKDAFDPTGRLNPGVDVLDA